MTMQGENSWEQAEFDFLGEHTHLPEHFPPVLFGCENQWEATADRIISEEPSVHIPIKTGFYEDFIEGDI